MRDRYRARALPEQSDLQDVEHGTMSEISDNVSTFVGSPPNALMYLCIHESAASSSFSPRFTAPRSPASVPCGNPNGPTR